ncbi:ABC transporter permease [Frankia sp. KB5]|uniref:ABC transporter permease n=1 Tax=Frankia sp. KB5 TaxID=683318 RepID=UPI000A0F51D9|nr:ABC transporter permease [Frankia sp. KB5]ORT47796.1 transporter [Frankia sp. KB5]
MSRPSGDRPARSEPARGRPVRGKPVRGGLAGGAVVLLAAVSLLGPVLAGGSVSAQVGLPFEAPSAAHPLGTDVVGRDVLTRLAHGGLPVVSLALCGTLLASVVGVAVGVAAALARGRAGELTVRAVDGFGVLPAVLLMLVLATGFPGSDLAVLVAVAVVGVPFSVRVVRAAAQQIAASGYVEVALARGDRRAAVIRRDVLPNIVRPILADAGLRFSAAVHLTAAAGFLGLGRSAPAPNWGRMVDENAPGVALTAWPFLAPVLALVVLSVSVNILTDRLATVLAERR